MSRLETNLERPEQVPHNQFESNNEKSLTIPLWNRWTKIAMFKKRREIVILKKTLLSLCSGEDSLDFFGFLTLPPTTGRA